MVWRTATEAFLCLPCRNYHHNANDRFGIMCLFEGEKGRKRRESFVGMMFLLIFVVVMMLFQSPIVWLMRVRKRKGYGVHSPFAFDLVTNVFYNKERYYAYMEMDRNLHWWQKGRVKSLRHLAFRLSNYHRPQTMYCGELDKALCEACQYGSQGVTILPRGQEGVADMVFVEGRDDEALRHVGEGTMLVLKGMNRCRSFWKSIREDERITVTFDLYDVGIAFARKDLKKQHYKINW